MNLQAWTPNFKLNEDTPMSQAVNQRNRQHKFKQTTEQVVDAQEANPNQNSGIGPSSQADSPVALENVKDPIPNPTVIDIETNGGKGWVFLMVQNDAQGPATTQQSTQKIPTDGIATSGVIGTYDDHRITIDRGKAGTVISTGLSPVSKAVGTATDPATQIHAEEVETMSHVAPLSLVKEVGTVPYVAPSPPIEEIGTMKLVAPPPLHKVVDEYMDIQFEDEVVIGDDVDDEHSEDPKEDDTCSHLLAAFNGHPDTATVIDAQALSPKNKPPHYLTRSKATISTLPPKHNLPKPF
ncbi:hypothetical protein A4A49_16837 [Nicotiana attenuata]|uniref:Uncharacterized protein n=1 Tax=Nicotiana attenuata TaxID=49451 RepID=A0A314KJA0_NICAT|nr:hypothetical protein A4A49_16837 [Nicotiana attenuata]